MNFVHLRMRNWEILFIQIDSNLNLSKTNKQTDAYFIWWRAKVVTRHNEKISPPRQATTAWEALFLQVIRYSINWSQHSSHNKTLINVMIKQGWNIKKPVRARRRLLLYWVQLLTHPLLPYIYSPPFFPYLHKLWYLHTCDTFPKSFHFLLLSE